MYGLIFLFKWRAEKDDRQIDYHAMEKVWFANQVITNACATQAIISVLFNRPELQLGDELSNLRSFSMDFPPQMKGHLILFLVPITILVHKKCADSISHA